MKKIIGLTGTTGSGKSTVAEIFERNGYFVIDCDKTAKDVVENDKDVLADLIAEFGDVIISPNGALNRSLLASLAFSSKNKTAKLNSITLPAIIKKVQKIINDSDNELILLDAPTLFESGANKLCCEIIGVTAPVNIRIDRITKRDGISEEQAVLRISAQKSDDFFKKNCTYIINNDKDTDALNEAAESLAKLISKQ